ncbi:hypothetical protein K402DRAFT_464821 [Aulographum hederae CBS 113979]|uniref:Smr domain-containing protein n=1 Tax=Aulographum hederae CBS 113979 TaxID=1176131 RepID=A0A6G1GV74_9PEZI|nr:hypothetical protein K402DRAFT_464821 [Aulographum hederae CBS 113979]
MEDPKEALAQELERDFFPVDSALIRALLSDYDWRDESQIAQLRAFLEEVKSEAVVEAHAGFDPSGSGGGRVEGAEKSDESEESWMRSDDTDLTSLSRGVEEMGFGEGKSPSLSPVEENGHDNGDGNGRAQFMDDMENLDIPAKEARLVDMFPTQSKANIEFTLKKCDGHFGKAMDVLLNHVYFDCTTDGEEKVHTKGIDAFAEDQMPRGRTTKGKRKNNKTDHINSSSSSSSRGGPPMPILPDSLKPSPPPPVPNKWKAATADISWISSRTSLPSESVTTLYHKNGASVRGTLIAILELDLKRNEKHVPDDTDIHNILSLQEEFPLIPPTMVSSMIRITNPSTSKAHELAKKLSEPEPRKIKEEDPIFIPHYTPVTGLPSNKDPTPKPDHKSSKRPSPPSSSSPSTSQLENGHKYTTEEKATLHAARTQARLNASRYHRAAKSDRLLSHAASYYATLASSASASLRSAASADADALVARQSSLNAHVGGWQGERFLDLHGVGTEDARRIVLREVRTGLRVVTGRGLHSKGGKGRLGPVVVRALIGEGWRVQVGEGEVLVVGRVG